MSSAQVAVPVAVVGISALFPGSSDEAGFWRDIVAGRDLITDVPRTHWLAEDYFDPDPTRPEKTYCQRGAFLSPVDFDPLEFGVPPSAVPATDTGQLLALIVARRLMDQLDRRRGEPLDRDRVSVILGATAVTELAVEMAARLQRPVWARVLRDAGLRAEQVEAICERIASSYVTWQETTFPGLLANVVAGRVANRLDLGGANFVTDAACASSFSALDTAVADLALGRSDLAITGGVDTFNDIFMYMCFSKTTALSPSGDCRPFSAASDGTLLGEGVAMMALRRLDDAERDADCIYGVLRGIGASSDGLAKSVYAPRREGQVKALRRAYRQAGYSPRSVELVEAHGTGTRRGDVTEFEALREVFEEAARQADGASAAGPPPVQPWCALGSVKSQIGHTKAAAGAAGLFKVLMALHHKVLPPTIKLEAPNPQLRVADSPFYLNTQARPWIHTGPEPRRASVSAFGFGGSNYHVTVEEYTGPAPRPPRLRPGPTELVLLESDSAAELLRRCEQAAAEAQGGGEGAAGGRGAPGEVGAPDLVAMARRTQEGFGGAAHRLAVVASTPTELAERIREAAARIAARPDEAFSLSPDVHYAAGSESGDLALLFPGQGSQYVGMGGDLAMAFDEVRAVWDTAAGIPVSDGLRLDRVVFPPPAFSDEERRTQANTLTATEWAQPAIAAVGLAALAVLRRLGIQPSCVAGHSLGELTALCAAGALGEADLLRLARRRGECMAAAASLPGAMTAVFCPLERLESLMAAWGLRGLVVANHNAPQQLVISGPEETMAQAEHRLAAERIRFRRLPVASAFHSPLVADATAPLQAFLGTVPFRKPQLRVFGNRDGLPYPTAPQEVRQRLAAQVLQPVLFMDQVEAMYRAGVRTFVEVGPGAVLSALVDETLDGRPHLAVSLDRRGQHGLSSLWTTVARLAVAGVRLDLAALWADRGPRPEAPRQPRPSLVLPVSGINYGRPYPGSHGAGAVAPGEASQHGSSEMRQADGAPGDARGAVVSPGADRPPAPAIPSGPPSGPQAGDAGGSWLASVREVLHRTAEAHAAFQRSVEEHAGLMRAVEASLARLEEQRGAGPEGPAAPQTATGAEPAHGRPEAARAAAAPDLGPVPPQAPPPAQAADPVPDPSGDPTPVSTGQHAASQAADPDLVDAVLAVVSERTGYPPGMLDLDVDLEAGLGIDSIKRVEILTTLQERFPEAAGVQPDLGPAATLRDIVALLGAGGRTPPPAPPDPVTPAAEAAPAAPAAAPRETEPRATRPGRVPAAAAHAEAAPASVSPSKPGPASGRVSGPVSAPKTGADTPGADTLLAIVAQKTGYPPDMLDLDLDIEAGLGIDSIKRVEIVSALQEQFPELAALHMADVSTLVTLRDILALVGEPGAASERVAAASVPPEGPRGEGEPRELPRAAAAPGGPGIGDEVNAAGGLDMPEAPDMAALMGEDGALDPAGVPLEAEWTGTGSGPEAAWHGPANGGGPAGGSRPHLPPPVPPAAGADAEAAIRPGAAEPLPAVALEPPDAGSVLLSVVAAKSGYPASMLDPDLDLEADLGIDAARRREILAEVHERCPALPSDAIERLGALPTIHEMLCYLRGRVPVGAPLSSGSRRAAVETWADPPGDTSRYVVVPVPAPAGGFAMRGLLSPGGWVAVTDDGAGVAPALVDTLVRRGVEARVISGTVPPDPWGVVALEGLAAVDGPAAAGALARQAFAAAQAVAHRMAAGGTGLFVTVQDTGGDGGLSGRAGRRAWLGGLAALARTAAREWPACAAKAIDLERAGRPPAELAEAIADELFSGGPEPEVGLAADGLRTTPVLRPQAARPGSLALDPGAVVVVTGGARGITAACLLALARQVPLRIAVLGRTVLAPEPPELQGATDEVALRRVLAARRSGGGGAPTAAALGREVQQVLAAREIRTCLQALAATKAEVRYLPVDVRDGDAVAMALREIRAAWGPVQALIHGAGTLADRSIAEKTAGPFDQVYDTKAAGLGHLLEATAADPLRLICCFSSAVGRTGNAGQADYAMANRVLSCVAAAEARRRGEECRVVSLAWGPWEGGMVSPTLGERFLSRGIGLLSLPDGARRFVEELSAVSDGAAEVVVAGSGGGDPLGGTADAAWSSEIHVSAATHPYLNDHRLRGTPVVPVVLVLEWFARTAVACRPDLQLAGLADLRVLHGIRLQDFDGAGHRLVVRCRGLAAGSRVRLALELASPEGRLHYTAEAEMEAVRRPLEAPRVVPQEDSGGWPWTAGEVYGDRLFHGPQFQVLHTLGHMEDGEASAVLLGTAHMGWAGGPWRTDPALLDGALQVVRLWGFHALGHGLLPTRVAWFVPWQRGLAAQPVRCVANSRIVGTRRVVSDVVLLAADGRCIAELRGIEGHLVPEAVAEAVGGARGGA